MVGRPAAVLMVLLNRYNIQDMAGSYLVLITKSSSCLKFQNICTAFTFRFSIRLEGGGRSGENPIKPSACPPKLAGPSL
jgi:hypothetical protein